MRHRSWWLGQVPPFVLHHCLPVLIALVDSQVDFLFYACPLRLSITLAHRTYKVSHVSLLALPWRA